MIQSISITLTSNNFPLIALLKFGVSLKIVLFIHSLFKKKFFFFFFPLNYNLRFKFEYSALTKLICTDKKNENKEVAVDDFLPSETAIDAIKYSM